MIRTALPLAVAAAMIPTAAGAAEVALQVAGPVVELTVTESVGANPDVVNISATVNTLEMTASAALQQNAERMARVLAAIDGQGVAEEDVRTTAISLTPTYEWDEIGRRQVFRGYRVSSTALVRLRDLPQTGRMLDAVITAGADEIGQISWSVDDAGRAEQQARTAAFETAQQRALGFARQAGYSGVRLLEVSEGPRGWGGPVPIAADAAVEARNMVMPIRPGQVETGVTISVKYEMTR